MGNLCAGFAKRANPSSRNSSGFAKSANPSSRNSSRSKVEAPTAADLKVLIRTNDARIAPKVLSRSGASTGAGLKSFSLNDLRTATRNFSSTALLGEGGFGCVFKGWIDEHTHTPTKPGVGIVVAIKKLKKESYQGHKEWLAEVTYLSQLHHENLVKLIGYCSEFDNKLLVYEYMQRGSLENHLFKRGTQPIPWATRVSIAIDVARGLSFLHGLETQVIFRDLKASNVLLDSVVSALKSQPIPEHSIPGHASTQDIELILELQLDRLQEFNAKLSDFGLARNGPTGDKSHVSTGVVGTRGYAAPEYIARGHLSSKSDMYSFGVVLLELLSGRRAVDEDRGSTEETLVEWAKPFLKDKRKMLRIMDTRLQGRYSKKEAQIISALALQCLHVDPKNRPKMTSVLPTLELLQASKSER